MKKYATTFVILFLLTILPGCGSASLPEATASDGTPERQLRFAVVESETPGITQEILADGITAIAYSGLAEVTIQADGSTLSLTEALNENVLTLPELFAFARLDAKNGYCSETYRSEKGLTHFTYTYPECDLQLAYDVYETPDGQQHLIEEISVHRISEGVRTSSHYYVDPQSPWGYFLDREDWGLTFAISDVSPEQITLDYTQQGGQQIGDLVVETYLLYPAQTPEDPEKGPQYLGSFRKDSWLPVTLGTNSAGQLTINWTQDIGTLAPGTYHLQLTVLDSYEESDLHPLTVKYYDRQSYWIAFAIE